MSIRNTDYFSLNRGGTPTQANSGTYHVVTGTELKEFVQPKAVTAAPTAPPTANESGYAIDTSVEPHQMYKWDTATSTWKPIGGASKPPLRARTGRAADFTTLTHEYSSRINNDFSFAAHDIDLPPKGTGSTGAWSWLGVKGEKINQYGTLIVAGTVAAHVRRMRVEAALVHSGHCYVIGAELEAGQSFEINPVAGRGHEIVVDGAQVVQITDLDNSKYPAYTYGAGYTGVSTGWLTGEDLHVGNFLDGSGNANAYAISVVGSTPFPIDLSLYASGGKYAVMWRAVVLLDDEHTAASSIAAAPWKMEAPGTSQTMNMEIVGEPLVAPVVWSMIGSPPPGATITGAGQTATLTAAPPDQEHYPVLIRATGDDGKFVEYATNLRALQVVEITPGSDQWDQYQFENTRLYFSDPSAGAYGRPFSTFATGVTLTGPDAGFFVYSSGRIRPAGPGPGASGRSQFHDPAADADGNNRYQVTVTATDTLTGETMSRDLTIFLTDREVTTISSSGIVTTPSGTTAAGQVYASSRASDGTPLPFTAITLLPTQDGLLFSYDNATGAVTFNAAPDVNNPQDYDKDNVYYYTLQAVSGTETVTKEVKVTVT